MFALLWFGKKRENFSSNQSYKYQKQSHGENGIQAFGTAKPLYATGLYKSIVFL